MHILVVGSGGREHALAWKLAQSKKVTKIYVTPGNAGTSLESKCQNIDIAAEDIKSLLQFAKSHDIDLTIVGPEVPLVKGIVDLFEDASLPCFGPSQTAAQLEGSKAFAKDFCARHNIPTPEYHVFADAVAAKAHIQECDMPVVIKADGLCAGKGVVIAHERSEAQATVINFFAGQHGKASSKVVIEDFVSGQEVSMIAIVDGQDFRFLASSQDHKARDDGNLGPNTGGMGAISPAPLMTEELQAQVEAEIFKPVIEGMAKEGTPYRGFLYAGLMIQEDGQPTVLEFNCRLGDPETQPILMRLQTDLITLIQSAFMGDLENCDIQWDPRAAVGVVLAQQGYPGSYDKGTPILNQVVSMPIGSQLFHAGTKRINNQIVTNGGRVLCATALGSDLLEAQSRAYQLADSARWEQAFFRSDIGAMAMID